MRKFFLMAGLLVLPASAVAQPLAWQKYTVPETGASVDLPRTIFSKDVGQTDKGYGRRFTTRDGHATFALQSIGNAAHESPAEFLAKKNPPPNIVYKRVAPRFFVVSSFRKDFIWYDRCNFAGRFINCVMVNYPAAEKRQWDGVITRISRSRITEQSHSISPFKSLCGWEGATSSTVKSSGILYDLHSIFTHLTA